MPSLIPKFVYKLSPFKKNVKGTDQITGERNGYGAPQSTSLADDDLTIRPSPLSENDILNFINQGEKHQLIPTIIDYNASHNPQKAFASIPVDNNDLSQGFRDITYFELRKAVDKAAYWLEETLRTYDEIKSNLEDQQQEEALKSSFPTFAFYGTRDLRYSIFAVAAIKVGKKMLSPSLFASMDAHVHLIKETDCHNIICIPTTRSLAEGITTNLHQSESSTYSISTTIAPEVADLLPLGKEAADDDSSSHYPYNKTWDEACNDPCLIVHTSGSTGMPKVIYYTQRMLANPATQSLLPSVEGRLPLLREWQGCRLLTTVPPFHLLGYAGFLVCPIYINAVGVMGPPDRPFDAALADEIHQYARFDAGMYHPSLLQDLVRDEDKRQQLSKLKLICYAGSPLETKTGQWLASEFGTVRNMLGSTESFGWPIAQVFDVKNDWNYIHFYPVNGIEFKPVGLASANHVESKIDDGVVQEEELYELVVHRTVETDALTNIFRSRPQATVWPTKDLWKPHPDPAKKNHWLYQGRSDDLIVLSGEIKMYAAHLEDKIASAHPLIRTALVGGHQRKWPFLLLELADYTTTIDDVWPRVNEINLHYTHSSVRLNRSLVLVTEPSRPFVRVAKGSVARNQTLELYRKDVDSLYAAMEQ
ncbi:hypothetical protein TMatcc_005213 [Talaromyces marneffei ATCC 18224]|uniref:AMP-binding enzyme, putative n=2 Tax=Talaromyces marneffei TaxID=37727 RepID=B6QBY4_TALMQ|nr:uncharacterized protein EYB26_006220 [Talaromyces marneffei]EEA26507.1 AMP-binding enzyme, putative [Talaromyces marneffei ATCC 18224]QGA18535.1 hypothetical protein EYB26_006220 [Talaromyces marneffei]